MFRGFLTLISILHFHLLLSSDHSPYDQVRDKIGASATWEQKSVLYDSIAKMAMEDDYDTYKKYLKLIIAESETQNQYDFAAKHLIALAQSFYSKSFAPDSALRIINQALEWKNKVSKKNHAIFMNIKGDYFFHTNIWDSAVIYYEKEIDIYEQLNDSSISEYARAYNYAADINYEKGRQNKSTKQLEKAYLLGQYQKDTANLISTLGLFANAYGGNGFLEKAAEYYEKAINLSHKIGHKRVTYLYENYSNIASRLGNDSLELALLRAGLATTDPSSKSEFSVLLRLTWAHANQNQCDSALYYFKLAEKENHQYTSTAWLQQRYSITKAYALLCQGAYSQCIDSANHILELSKQQNAFGITLEMESLIYKAYHAMGNYKMAFDHHSNFADLRDSLFSVEKSSALAFLETKFETEQKERQIDEQEDEILFLQAKSEFRTRLSWTIGIGTLFLFGAIYLYRSRQYALKSKSMQESFSRQLLSSHEEERKRISRDLHDSVGQSLILIKNKISLNQDESTTTMVSQALEEVRNISKALHPEVLDKLGLTAAIQKLIHDVDEVTDIFFSEEIDPIDGIFTQEQELQIYRIIQEALNNLIKHSKTESALIRASNEHGKVSILVKDYGLGFDLTENNEVFTSLGMKTLKERAQLLGGKIMVDSTKNIGTTIFLELKKPNTGQNT